MKRREIYLVIAIIIAIIMALLLSFALSRFVISSEKEIVVLLKDAKISKTDIIIDPTEWTKDKVSTSINNEKGGETYYKIGENGEWTKYDASFDIYENCILYTKIVYNDGEGPETVKEISNIDKVEPKVTLTPNGEECIINSGEENTVISVKIFAEDEVGELKDLKYAWSTSNTEEPTEWLDFTNNEPIENIVSSGTYYLWTNVTDKAGNISTNVSNEYNVKYEIKYDANNGQNAPQAQSKSKGEPITLSTDEPTRVGYTFLGWATSDSASVVEYYKGGVYSEDVAITLYAVWSPNNYQNTTTGTYYPTLKSAFDEVETGEEIKVLESVTETETPVLETGKNAILNLNNQTTTLSSVSLTNNANLTIKGESGTITGSGADTIKNTGTLLKDTQTEIANTSTAYYYVINNSGIATISAGTINGNYRGIYNDVSGKVEVTGGTIKSSADLSIRNDGEGEIVISGGTVVSGSVAVGNIGVGTVIISGGSIKTTNNNDTIWNKSTGKIEMSGGEVISEGRAAFSMSNGTLEITGGTVKGKTHGIGASGTNKTTITIGKKDSNVSISSPSIIGYNTTGIAVGAGTFNFYDGKIQGPEGASISGTVSDVPDGYAVTKNNEIIDDTTYEVAVLGPSAPVITAKLTDANGATYTSGTWTNKDIYISLKSANVGAGIKEYQRYLNGTWTKSNITTSNNVGTISFAENINETVKFRAVDNNGVISQESSIVLKRDSTAPTVTLTEDSNTSYANAIKIDASDNVNIQSYGISTSASTQPTTWINVNSVDLTGVQTKVEYGATWARVFYHNNVNGSVLFTSDSEVLSCDTRYKYSILGKLDNFKNSSGKFEFLLQYPNTAPNEYNRWIQTGNPVTTTVANGDGSANAPGYEAIHVDWTEKYWGGLTKSTDNSTYINGSVGYGSWYYAIGSKAKWKNGIPGKDANAAERTVVELWVRIDNLPTANKKIISTKIGNIKTNGTYYVWVKDHIGNITSKSITTTKVDTTGPTVSLASSNTNPTNANVTLTATASDAESGLYSTAYSWQGDNSWGSANTYTATANGTYTVYVRNNIGKITSKSITVSNIDKVAPTAPTITNSSGGNWTNGTVSITLSSTDTGLGVEKYQVKYSGTSNAWKDLTGNTDSWSDEINETVYYRAVDKAGNASAESSTSIKIDKTAPTVTFGTNGNSTASKTASTKVTVTDSLSGVKTSTLKYLWTTRSSGITNASFVGSNSGTFSSGQTISIPSGNAGTYYLWIYAEDNIGQSIVTKTNKFVVGNITPEADITLSTTSWTNQNITMTIKPYAPTVLYDNGDVITTNRDWYAAAFPTTAYANKKFRISGKVQTLQTADTSKTTSIGFQYVDTSNAYKWSGYYGVTTGTASTEQSFNVIATVPSAYSSSLKPWIQINVPSGTAGYKVEYKNIKYEYFDYTKIKSVTVNGTAITLTDGVGTYTVSANGTYTIVVTDIYGNSRTFTKEVTNIDKAAPTMTSAEIKNVTATGYDVYIYGVKDAGSGVNRVQFPTWTSLNGQDDIQSNWENSSAAKGTKQSDGTTWVYRVNTTEHNNESGTYYTHIYVYDNLGNKKGISAHTITVPNVTVTYDYNYMDNDIYGNKPLTTNFSSAGVATGTTSRADNSSAKYGNEIRYTVTKAGTGGAHISPGRLTVGKTYTWSVYIKASKNITINLGQEQGGVKQVNLTTSWQRFTHTFTAQNTTYSSFVFYSIGGNSGSWAVGDVMYMHSLELKETPTLNITTQSKAYNTALGTLPSTSRTGYTFQGWYTAPVGGTQISSTTKVPANNVTYYAHWEILLLANVVKVGDYVNYNAASGNGAGKSYTTEKTLTGSSTTATFSSSDTMKWKVMSVNKATGTVELMAENPTANKVTLYGKTGYKNAETVLNKVGAVYGYGDGATGGRSITVEDVNKLENYTPTDDLATSFTYTSGTFINEDGTEVTATTNNPVTMRYTASTAEKSINKHYRYTTTNFSGKIFWLGSRCINLNSSICIFFVRVVDSGGVGSGDLFYSYGSEYGSGRAVLPVVSLKSNIQTSGKDSSGAWNLINTTASATSTFSLRSRSLYSLNNQAVSSNTDNESSSSDETSENTTSESESNLSSNNELQTNNESLAREEEIYQLSETNSSNNNDVQTDNNSLAREEEIYQKENLKIRLEAANNYNGEHSDTTTIWKDTTENKNDGVIINGVWGKDYLELNGTTSVVKVPEINSDYKTIEVKFSVNELSKTANQYIIGNSSDGGVYIFISSDGYINGKINIDGVYQTVKSTTKVEEGKTYNVAISYDGNVINLYINGTEESKKEVIGKIKNPEESAVMLIGANSNYDKEEEELLEFFNGKIYTVAIYNESLTNAQVNNNILQSE